MDPWFVIAGSAAVAALMGALRQRTTQLWAEQTAQAKELGLTVTDLGRWVGRHEGIHVVVQVDTEPHDPWSVRAKLPFATPRGFHLGPPGAGRDAALLRVSVLDLLERLDARGWRTELGPSIILRRPRQFSPITSGQRQIELADGVRCVVQLVRTLQRRHRRLIGDGIRRVENSIPRLGTGFSRPKALRGTVEGVPLSLVGPRLVDGGWELEIRAPVAPALPPRTLVRARSGRLRGSLGDLVLDQALEATSTDLRSLSRRLARDDVRGPLLDVLAAHPRSELHPTEVLHVVADGALDVSGALDRVLELVRVLGRDGATAQSSVTSPP